MKKAMLIIMYIVLSTMAFSQLVDTTTYVYCRAVSISKNAFNMNKEGDVEIYLDYGNGNVIIPKNSVKDKKGKETDIDNVVDLLNFMAAKRWSLDKTYQVYFGSSNVKLMTNFIFKKPKYNNLQSEN